MIEYIAPYFHITVGSKEIKKIKSFEHISSRITPVDLAEIELTSKEDSLQVGQEIIIKQGYRTKGLWQLFKGNINNLTNDNRTKLFCKDNMAALKEVKITKSFVDCTPQDILRYSLNQAGVDYTLSSKVFRKKHHFVVRNRDVITLVKLINETWGLDFDFYFDDETFFWGSWQESPRYSTEEIVKFEYGKNIIELTPNRDGSGLLKTIAVPFLKHSNVIKITHPSFEGLAKIDRIRNHYQDKGRCYIEWQELKN
ncbi:hypothetical protein JCM16358_23220 [Halanaerocella petrolearia]